MSDLDEVSSRLIEEAKRYLELAAENSSEDARAAYCDAALLLGYCALEAHVNAISEELAIRKGLGVLDLSILRELDFALENGSYVIGKRLKMYRLEDRIRYILAKFTSRGSATDEAWWPDLKAGLDSRNRLVHPKGSVRLTTNHVARALTSIIDCLNSLYEGVFKRRFPALRRGLDSSLHF